MSALIGPAAGASGGQLDAGLALPEAEKGGGVVLCGDLRSAGGSDALSSTIRRAVQPHSHLQMRRSNRPGGCGVHQGGGAPRPVQRERSTRVSGDLHGHPPTLLIITGSRGENVPGTLIGRSAEWAAIVQRSERPTHYRHGVAPKVLDIKWDGHGFCSGGVVAAVGGEARGQHDALLKKWQVGTGR